MQHKGEILQKVVAKRMPNKSELAKLLGYNRSAIYRHYADPELDDGIILKYAKALKYDFSREFPELNTYTNTLHEPLADYKPITLSEALKEVDHWRRKYIELLERHNDLLKTMLQQ